MRGLMLIAFVCVVGCDHSWNPPMAEVRLVSAPDQESAWSEVAGEAVAEWNYRLVDVGCPAPFAITTTGGHPLKLVPRDRWDHTGAIGVEDADRIDVRADASGGPWGGDVPVVVRHELGHAIGLEHADPRGGPSIMIEQSDDGSDQRITDRDTNGAACAMGCTACR